MVKNLDIRGFYFIQLTLVAATKGLGFPVLCFPETFFQPVENVLGQLNHDQKIVLIDARNTVTLVIGLARISGPINSRRVPFDALRA